MDYGLWSQAREPIWSDKPAALLELRTPVLCHLAALLVEKNRECVAASPKRVRLCIVARKGHFGKSAAEAL